MVMKSPSTLRPLGLMTLQEAFEEAVLCFLFGPPRHEEEALKRVKAISDFAKKHMYMFESDFDI